MLPEGSALPENMEPLCEPSGLRIEKNSYSGEQASDLASPSESSMYMTGSLAALEGEGEGGGVRGEKGGREGEGGEEGLKVGNVVGEAGEGHDTSCSAVSPVWTASFQSRASCWQASVSKTLRVMISLIPAAYRMDHINEGLAQMDGPPPVSVCLLSSCDSAGCWTTASHGDAGCWTTASSCLAANSG